ncbi:CvfB family protein [Spongiimicrobium salis]|uniref:CvfB family protein n=1 Tax=Spongiimicrobium salis TaxID=1667022 RepID=UPI00374D5919
MIALGKYNTLEILRSTSVGLFLGDGEGHDVLLPNKYVPRTYEIGEMLEIFCYLDYEERPIATTLKPHILRNSYALLRVVDVNEIGAFMDWGLEKHLLVPFREQRSKMQEGQSYVVYCYLDEETFRLVASNKLDKFLDKEAVSLKERDEVDLIVTRKTDLGWEVIINNSHKGLVFKSEVFRTLAIGDKLKGYVKNIREDQKIDVSLEPIGTKKLEPMAQKIYEELQKENGFLSLHDKSDPELIKERLQMSKKNFKKGVGTLYKARKIVIEPNGIRLI